jgi:DNA (cytosine-5)-methyltransferase 1
MSLKAHDIFAGAGGESIGLAEAGIEILLAANHWDRAIETHSANFPDAEHLCADVSNYDLRRLPRGADIGWFSPECTWHSPAGGRRKLRAQLDLLDDYVPTDGGIRSRATMLDVFRATEVHRYKIVVVENVVEVADWPSYDWWLDGIRGLGYDVQIICVNSAHIGDEDNPRAPQWRDRWFALFTRHDVGPMNLQPRPLALCVECDETVLAVQWWKNPKRRQIGKYGQQYLYRCPNSRCKHTIVEPYVRPAASAIDWTDLGTRIGDRPRPLAKNTLRRIQAGLDMFCQPTVVAAAGNTWEAPGGSYVRAQPAYDAPLMARTCTGQDAVATHPLLVTLNHGGHDGRVQDPTSAPLAPRTTKIGEAVVTPFVVNGQSGGVESRVDAVTQPLRTVVANGRGHHQLVTPPLLVANRTHNRSRSVDEPIPPLTTGSNLGLASPPGFVTMANRNGRARHPGHEPLPTLTAGGNHHELVTPFYVKAFGGNARPEHMAKPITDPLGTITTQDHHWLVIPYRRGAKPHRPDATALSTVATREQHGLLAAAVELEDCYFRMLQPREHLRAQRFPDVYVVLGNKGEQTMQAGNAVSSNVAHWIGKAIRAHLDAA